MSKLSSITPVASLLVIALTGGTGLTACTTSMKPAPPMAAKMADGSCGEGKCGAAKPDAMHKMADGSCGEGKCGAAKPDAMHKMADGSCGEAKCGAAKPMADMAK